MQLANAMKLVRQQNGWTQSELAKKIGIKQATISNFENNPNNTSLTTFFKIYSRLNSQWRYATQKMPRQKQQNSKIWSGDA